MKAIARILAALLLALLPGAAGAQTTTPVQPRACDVSIVTTGGTAVTALSGPTNGIFLGNGLTATDEGIGTAEPLYFDPTGGAPGTVSNSTVQRLDPGASVAWWVPFGSTVAVKVNAATSGHKFTCVRW